MKSCSYNTYHLFFRNFSTPVRINIISLLRRGEMSVKELSEKSGMEQSKISHALESMKNCGVVISEKKGKQRIYSLNKSLTLPIFNVIEKHKCSLCKNRK